MPDDPLNPFQRDVIDRLGRIEQKLDNDYHELHGKGKPGLIERMMDVEKDVCVIKARSSWVRDWLGWILAGGVGIKELARFIVSHGGN